MQYDFYTYQADRRLMGYDPHIGITEHGLKLRVRRLAINGDPTDKAAIDDAHARLLAWAKSGTPEPTEEINETEGGIGSAGQGVPMRPVPQSKAKPRAGLKADPAKVPSAKAAADVKQPSKAVQKARLRWRFELAAQAERHERRRSEYPKVRPETETT